MIHTNIFSHELQWKCPKEKNPYLSFRVTKEQIIIRLHPGMLCVLTACYMHTLHTQHTTHNAQSSKSRSCIAAADFPPEQRMCGESEVHVTGLMWCLHWTSWANRPEWCGRYLTAAPWGGGGLLLLLLLPHWAEVKYITTRNNNHQIHFEQRTQAVSQFSGCILRRTRLCSRLPVASPACPAATGVA